MKNVQILTENDLFGKGQFCYFHATTFIWTLRFHGVRVAEDQQLGFAMFFEKHVFICSFWKSFIINQDFKITIDFIKIYLRNVETDISRFRAYIYYFFDNAVYPLEHSELSINPFSIWNAKYSFVLIQLQHCLLFFLDQNAKILIWKIVKCLWLIFSQQRDLGLKYELQLRSQSENAMLRERFAKNLVIMSLNYLLNEKWNHNRISLRWQKLWKRTTSSWFKLKQWNEWICVFDAKHHNLCFHKRS